MAQTFEISLVHRYYPQLLRDDVAVSERESAALRAKIALHLEPGAEVTFERRTIQDFLERLRNAGCWVRCDVHDEAGRTVCTALATPVSRARSFCLRVFRVSSGRREPARPFSATKPLDPDRPLNLVRADIPPPPPPPPTPPRPQTRWRGHPGGKLSGLLHSVALQAGMFSPNLANPLDRFLKSVRPFQLADGVPAAPLTIALRDPRQLQRFRKKIEDTNWPSKVAPHGLVVAVAAEVSRNAFRLGGTTYVVRDGVVSVGCGVGTRGPHLVAGLYTRSGGRYAITRAHTHPLSDSNVLIDSDNERMVLRWLEQSCRAHGFKFSITKLHYFTDLGGVVCSFDFVLTARVGKSAHHFLIEVLGFENSSYLAPKAEQGIKLHECGHSVHLVSAFASPRILACERSALEMAISVWLAEVMQHGSESRSYENARRWDANLTEFTSRQLRSVFRRG